MDIRGKESVLHALRDGEPVLVIVLGGGMSCVFSLGVLVSLVRMNLHRFSHAIGVSGGACNVAALLSNPGEMRSVMKVFEYLARGGFLRLKLGPFGWYVWFDIAELINALEGKVQHEDLPALNEDNVVSHPCSFRVGATDHKTGKGVFLDAKSDLFLKLRITASVQGACSHVTIGTRMLSDGQIGVGKRIGPALGRMAKKVLVIMNRPLIEDRTWWEQQFSPWFTRFLLAAENPEIREAAVKMDNFISRGVRRLEACTHTDTLVISPNWIEDIFPLTNNVPLLGLTFQNAANGIERYAKRIGAV